MKNYMIGKYLATEYTKITSFLMLMAKMRLVSYEFSINSLLAINNNFVRKTDHRDNNNV